jgi:hypothetical protein
MYSNALFSAGLRFPDPFPRKVKIRGLLTCTPSLENQYLNILSVFIFSHKIVMRATPFFLKFLEHHMVWLEDLIELSNCFYAPIHLRLRVTNF